MVSKKQATAIGDALADGNRTRNRQPSKRHRLYPELEKIPESDQDLALKTAQSRALRSWPIAVVAVLVAGYLALVYLSWGSEDGSISQFSAIGMAVASISGWVFRSRARMELRRSAWLPGTSSTEEWHGALSDKE